MFSIANMGATQIMVLGLVVFTVCLVDIYLGYTFGRRQAEEAWRNKLERKEKEHEEQIRFLGNQFRRERLHREAQARPKLEPND